MRIPLSVILCGVAVFAADSGRRAPGFSLPDVKGQQHDLADYRGKVVVLDFIQTTCPHCNAFAGILNEAQQRYGDRVAVLSVVNPPDDASKVNNFIAAHRLIYPVVFDSGQVAYSYLRSPSFDIPHLYLIDPNGYIREDIGYSDAQKDLFEGKGLFAHIDAMLAAGPAPGGGKKK